jgi:hypothetical protein
MLCIVQFKEGDKRAFVWIESTYCIRRGIGRHTVADIVKQALKRQGWLERDDRLDLNS